ncbi:MAG: hypothetical protein ABIH40_04255 [Candidatus Omnitrophota bacterium]
MPLKKIVNKLLGELLIERQAITSEQLNKALDVQKEKGGLIGEILVQMGSAKEEDIAQALTAQYGFPYLPLENYEIDTEIIKLIPKNVAKQYLIIPVDRLGNNLSIALANPLSSETVEKVEKITGLNLQVFVSTASDIRKAIDKYYNEK